MKFHLAFSTVIVLMFSAVAVAPMTPTAGADETSIDGSNPESARETNFGPIYADNSAQSYFYDDDLTSAEHTGMENARKISLDGATDITTSVNSTYNQQVDVWVYNTYRPSGDQTHWYAWTTCVRMVSGSSTKCDQHTVVYNEQIPHPDYWALSCHEQGHSVGFGDGSGSNSSYSASGRSCMRGTPDVHQYSSSDISRINSHY